MLVLLLATASAAAGCRPARTVELPDGRVLEFDAAMLVPSDAGRDAARPDAWAVAVDAGSAQTAYGRVGGLHAMSFDFTDPPNYVDCTLTSSGLLGISAYPSPLDHSLGFNAYIELYTGPSTYSFTYTHAVGGSPLLLDAYTPGGYSYAFFYDFSRLDGHEEYSRCTFDIRAAASGSGIEGTIVCEDLIARSTSPDWEDNPVAWEPRSALNAVFTCDL
jgi:hypothetical protein